mgnify:FL=1
MTVNQLVNYQYPPSDATAAQLKAFCEGEPHDIWHLSKAYLYGVMVGKRMERARRKRNKK